MKFIIHPAKNKKGWKIVNSTTFTLIEKVIFNLVEEDGSGDSEILSCELMLLVQMLHEI